MGLRLRIIKIKDNQQFMGSGLGRSPLKRGKHEMKKEEYYKELKDIERRIEIYGKLPELIEEIQELNEAREAWIIRQRPFWITDSACPAGI